MKKGRMAEAYASMRRLRKHDVQAARDLVSTSINAYKEIELIDE